MDKEAWRATVHGVTGHDATKHTLAAEISVSIPGDPGAILGE